jgi:hypothetical protein
MIVRTIFGTLATTALALGGTAAPVNATSGHHDHHDDEVKLKVCAFFKDDDHHHGDDDHNGDDRAGHHDDGDEGVVNIYARTDEERKFAQLSDRECAWFELEFDDNWLRVGAFPQRDQWHHKRTVQYKAFGDVENAYVTPRNWLKVWFDDDEHDPFVGVGVLVSDRHHHDHDDDDD